VYPSRFGADAGVKRPAIAGRVSAALDAAIGKAWLKPTASRFAIGVNSPAKLERDRAANEMRELIGDFGSHGQEVLS